MTEMSPAARALESRIRIRLGYGADRGNVMVVRTLIRPLAIAMAEAGFEADDLARLHLPGPEEPTPWVGMQLGTCLLALKDIDVPGRRTSDSPVLQIWFPDGHPRASQWVLYPSDDSLHITWHWSVGVQTGLLPVTKLEGRFGKEILRLLIMELAPYLRGGTK